MTASHYDPQLHGSPGKLELGRWVNATLRVISENVGLLLPVTALLLFPHLLFQLALGSFGELLVDDPIAPDGSIHSRLLAVSAAGTVVLWVLSAIVQGAVVFIVVQWMNARKATIGAA